MHSPVTMELRFARETAGCGPAGRGGWLTEVRED